MPSRNERFIGIYELSIRPTGVPEATAPIAQTAIAKIKAAVDAAKSQDSPIRKDLRGDRLCVMFDDVKIYPRRHLAAMLFTVADVDAAAKAERRSG